MPKLAPLLASDFTVISYDRRGRGDSGDTQPYAVEREIEDLDALIRAAGGAAHVLGISSGAVLALKAAASGLGIMNLALYEPPFVAVSEAGHRAPPDSVAQLTRMIAAGRRGEAVKFYLTQVMGAPRIFYYGMRIMPLWRKVKAVARMVRKVHPQHWRIPLANPGWEPFPQFVRTPPQGKMSAARAWQ